MASSGERSSTSAPRSPERARRRGFVAALTLAALGSVAFALAILERGRAPLVPALWLALFFGVLLLQVALLRAVPRRSAAVDSTQEQLVVRLEADVAARTRELAARAAELRDANRFQEALLETTPALIYTYDADGTFHSVNRATAELLGEPAASLAGREMGPYLSTDSAAELPERIERLRRDGEIEGEVEAELADGRRRWIRYRNRRLELDGRELFLGTAIDVTERKQAEQLLAEQALHDPLTGLANRRLLDDRLAQALAMAERRVYRGGASRVALFALDLDGFKAVNDELGHGVGDRLLAEVARAAAQQIRRVDTLARLGGDEFVVLLTEAGDNEQLLGLAQRLLNSIANASEEVSPDLEVTASLGIARFPDDAFEGAALLAAADRALLLAKNEGKNRIRFARS